jgi:hypothetical protein
MNNPKKLEEEVSEWPNISIHPHRFGGREFLFGEVEVGRMHVGFRIRLDHFPCPLRTGLRPCPLAHGLSYLRHALKTASDPRGCWSKKENTHT